MDQSFITAYTGARLSFLTTSSRLQISWKHALPNPRIGHNHGCWIDLSGGKCRYSAPLRNTNDSKSIGSCCTADSMRVRWEITIRCCARRPRRCFRDLRRRHRISYLISGEILARSWG